MSRRLVNVDHSGEPGGGQLGLKRYVASDARTFASKVVFLTGGPVADELAMQNGNVDVLTDVPFRLKDVPRHALRLRAYARRNITDDDLVVVNSLYAAAAASLVPHLRWAYYSRVSMDSLAGLRRFVCMRFIFPRATGFLANSTWTLSCIPEELLAKRRAAVAYPVSGASPNPVPRTDVPLSRDIIRVVSLSRLDRWKGVDLIIRGLNLAAEKSKRPIQLDIVGGSFFGHSAYRDELEALAAEGTVRTTFHGHVDDVDSLLRDADVLALGTLMPEPFGQTVVQGLSAGCIVLAPEAGGPKEIIEKDVSGLLYEMGNAPSMAERLLSITEDGERCAAMSHEAQRRSCSFADDSMVRMYEAAVAEVLK